MKTVTYGRTSASTEGSKMPHRDSKDRSLGERINTWMQIAALFIAACWGFWTFYHKEYSAPKAAPVNISLNLQLKRIEGNTTNKGLTAVEMRVSAMNPSSRQIWLLPSAWAAYGINIENIEESETTNTDFKKAANARLAAPDDIEPEERHVRSTQAAVVVAAGHLFSDEVLKPSEITSRTILFYVPENTYDSLEVRAMMPCAKDVSKIRMRWRLTAQDFEQTTFRRDKKTWKWTPLPIDKAGNYREKEDRRLVAKAELQMAVATSEISLWPKAEADGADQSDATAKVIKNSINP